MIGIFIFIVFALGVSNCVVLPNRYETAVNGYASGLQRVNFAQRSGAAALASQNKENGCFCLNDTCACCRHIDIPRFHINDTGCLELVYLRHDVGLSLIFTIDDYVVINRTVSVRNPPPVCYAVPHVSAANLCLQFYNLDYDAASVSGCIRVKAELADIDIYDKDLGCFRIPLKRRYAGTKGPTSDFLWNMIRERMYTHTPTNSTSSRYVYGRHNWRFL